MRRLLLQYRYDGTLHDDLLLQLDGYSHLADSYFLARGDAAAESPPGNDVRRLLIDLLQRWIRVLRQAEPARPAYLAYDFDDERTGALRCTPRGHLLEITPGWVSYESWCYTPENLDKDFFDWHGFDPADFGPIRLPHEQFEHRIQESIDVLKREFKESRQTWWHAQHRH